MNIEIIDKQYERLLNWDDAKLYCSLLVAEGKNDWRLPTLDELNNIYLSEYESMESYYWSSTELFKDGSTYAYALNLLSGTQFTYGHKHTSFFVRPVRTIEQL